MQLFSLQPLCCSKTDFGINLIRHKKKQGFLREKKLLAECTASIIFREEDNKTSTVQCTMYIFNPDLELKLNRSEEQLIQ